MNRTKRHRRFPSVYRGPDLTDPETDLGDFDDEEIEHFLASSKLSDAELAELNFRDIDADVQRFTELVGTDTNAGATLGKDAIDEVN